MLKGALSEVGMLSKQRNEIDSKLFKLRQFIYATVNMLPDTERNVYQAEIAQLAAQMGSLTDSVREILRLAAQRNSYFTAAEVRDQLVKAGFDFSGYTSNPLASVNTILRRLKGSEVEVTKRNGIAAYRWKAQIGQLSSV
jgi:hypothetical protein